MSVLISPWDNRSPPVWLLDGVHLVVGPLEEDGIAKLVCAIAASVQFLVDTAKHFIVDESAQQLVMTGAAGVGSGENSTVDQKHHAPA